jgi:hypothetical protein
LLIWPNPFGLSLEPQLNRSEIWKSPAKNQATSFSFLGSAASKLSRAATARTEQCHTLIMRLPRFSPTSNPISAVGVSSGDQYRGRVSAIAQSISAEHERRGRRVSPSQMLDTGLMSSLLQMQS